MFSRAPSFKVQNTACTNAALIISRPVEELRAEALRRSSLRSCSCTLATRSDYRRIENALAIRQESSNNEGDPLFPQLFQCDLQRICFALEIDQWRRVHASVIISTALVLESCLCNSMHLQDTHLICVALVPNTLARSYLVM